MYSITISFARFGVSTDTRAYEALELLLTFCEQITDSSPVPEIDPDSPEELLRLIVAVAWSGDYSAYGHVHGIYRAVNAMCEFLNVERIADTRNISKGELSQAVLATCAAVPDRTVSECVRVLRRLIRICGQVEYDLRQVRDFDANRIHKSIQLLCDQPIPAIYILRAIGLSHTPLPSGGGTAVLLRLSLLDWRIPEVIIGGFPAAREEARRALEGYPDEVFVAVEYLSRICPDGCPICVCNQVCPQLCSEADGWI